MQDDSFSRYLSGEAEAARVRFVVGIDLGTTNSAVSYVDLDAAERSLEILPIPQAVAVGVLEERTTLPSFFCRSADAPTEPTNPERRDFSTKKPPKDGKIGVVGAFARDFGTAEPDSFVSSAKSWLCHSGVDRTAKILPWSTDAEAGALRWSPVEISSFFLRRIRDAWNARFPEFPLETQDVVLTIPASFDETARELTIRAAKLAGIPKLALVEEPQAAFYAWLEGRENDWTAFVKPGEKILVCDVGGGTTDFALIYALQRNDAAENSGNGQNGESGGVRFYRVAVGDHLILGGDNLDLALFHFLEQKFAEKRSTPLSARERAALLRESRETKEFFLSANAENREEAQNRKSRRVVLPGSGAKLVGGGLSVEVERADVEKILLDGFFPRVPLDAAPVRRRVGVREIALPYAPDPAITKYLANFLTTRRDAGLELERSGIFDGSAGRETGKNGEIGAVGENGASVDRARPDVVLFNGGAFESPTLRARIVDSLVDWFGGAETGWRPKVLQNENLYWAVAKGAAYYGLVRRGLGTRIGASLARTYYVGVATDEKTGETGKPGKMGENGKAGEAAKAVCLLPARAEPGDEVTLPKTFELAVDRPVSFPIFVSSVRTTDAPGDLIEIDPNEIRELAPICTALKTRSQAKKDAKTIRARLVARPTEIGTIELFLQEVLPEKAEGTEAANAENGGKNGESASGAAGKSGRRTRASRWALQFDARGGTQTDWEATANEGESEGVVDESLVEAARLVLTAAFATDEALRQTNETRTAAGLEPLERVKPGDLFRRLAEAVGTSRNEFPITLLRRLAETTLELADGRRRQAAVEARWLNWLGFALRPGFGAATDDWRVEQTWKAVSGALAFGTPESRTQYWILWRRIASGLGAGRQKTLAEPLLGNLRALRRRLVDGRGKGPDVDLTSQEGAEIWRLLGALELLPPETKEEIGAIILDVLSKKNLRPIRDALVWALGRVGARTLFNAPLDRVVPAATASDWARRFLAFLQERDEPPTATDFFALARLTRRSGEAAFDVDGATRDAVAAFLAKNGVAETTERALDAKERVVDAETTAIFGETLPLGLRWS